MTTATPGEGALPCPFCGVGERVMLAGAGGWFVSCQNCEARGPWSAHASGAADGWNNPMVPRRAATAPDALRAAVDALDKLVADSCALGDWPLRSQMESILRAHLAPGAAS